MIVALGNRNAATATVSENGDKKMEALAKGKRATIINFPDEWSLAQCFRALTDGDGVLNNHFKPGTTPTWVASENASLATLIAENFGDIEIRELKLEGGAVAPDTDQEVAP